MSGTAGSFNGANISIETVALTGGDQVITVADASKIVGFTLESTFDWLATASGKMSGTWMVGTNRNKLRCFIQTFEPPYMKFLICSLEINDASGTITISGTTSRYYDVTAATPQPTLSADQGKYKYATIALIRQG